MTIVEVCATADPIPPANRPTAMTAVSEITLRRTIMFASFVSRTPEAPATL
jgi:hypothetical protein